MKTRLIKVLSLLMALTVFIFGSGVVTAHAYGSDGEYTSPSEDCASETEPYEISETELTPDGNMDLVDDIDDSEENMQFLTVITKDGHYFYIVIERTKDSENVHFLNQVDIRDLLSLMSKEEVKEYQDAQKQEEPETTAPVIKPETEPETKTDLEPETKPEPAEPAKKETANPFKTLGLFILIGAAVAGGYYFVKIRPSKGRGRYDDLDFDDDAEYVEDHTEEKEPAFRDVESEAE